MRRAASFIAAITLLTPVLAGALTVSDLQAQIASLVQQITSLQAQIQARVQAPAASSTNPAVTVAAPALTCNFFHTLVRGAVGNDVLELQRYLLRENYLASVAVSGSFDATTEAAVQNWQAAHNIVWGGTPATTGYGAAGPRTRALMQLNCKALAEKPTCELAPKPNFTCAGTWNAKKNSSGCIAAWECVVSLNDLPALPMCPAIAVACPPNTHDTISPTCAHQCVSDAVAPTCPAPIIPSCPGGMLGALGNDASGCNKGYVCFTQPVTNSACPHYNTLECPAGYHEQQGAVDPVSQCAATPSCQPDITGAIERSQVAGALAAIEQALTYIIQKLAP